MACECVAGCELAAVVVSRGGERNQTLPIGGGLGSWGCRQCRSPLSCWCSLSCDTGRAGRYHRPRKSKLKTKDSNLRGGMAEACVVVLGQHRLAAFPSCEEASLRLHGTESCQECPRSTREQAWRSECAHVRERRPQINELKCLLRALHAALPSKDDTGVQGEL